MSYTIKIKHSLADTLSPDVPEGIVLIMSNGSLLFAEITKDTTANSALEKQIPKAPEWKAMAGFDASVASSLACPTCGEGVTNYWAPSTKPKHCQFCGQALDWGEEADE